METTRESDAGYPEEEPPEVAGDQTGTNQRERSQPSEGGRHGEGSSPETESGDGKATGNPKT
jgi:hypothetical protein